VNILEEMKKLFGTIFQDDHDHDIATTCFDLRKTISLAYDFSGSEDVPGGLGDPFHTGSFGYVLQSLPFSS
jgi:hypothetical protein